MPFNAEQMKVLEGPLNSRHVKTREQGGRKLSYIEGWLAISEANRIFGFDAWTRETIETRVVAERERKIGKAGDLGWGVTYVAKVRITVTAGDEKIVREGCGTGHGIDRDLGQAHESAIKEAETDAMKRALMTFGNPFGLALYDKEQVNVVDEDDMAERRNKAAFIKSTELFIDNFKTVKEMKEWWESEDQKKARRDFELSQDEVKALQARLVTQKDRIEEREAA